MALDCERFGADGITVHPRPDERHVKFADVLALKPILSTPFNIEGYPSRQFIDLVVRVKPAQVTLVPDPPGALTSNAGWDTVLHKDFLTEVIHEFKQHGIRTSVFTDTLIKHIDGAAKIETDRIELYTEDYACHFPQNKEMAVKPYVVAAQHAASLGLGLNAGHDLNAQNLAFFSASIPNLLEVSIGHALICDALYWGLENTIQIYKRALH